MIFHDHSYMEIVIACQVRSLCPKMQGTPEKSPVIPAFGHQIGLESSLAPRKTAENWDAPDFTMVKK
jgi:hypothetical protein